YLGNATTKGTSPPDMRLPMRCYLLRLMCCGLALAASYLVQLRLFNEAIGQPRAGIVHRHTQ
ncbi:MAG: hypothetical protein ACM337_03835, partial [Syntrophaceae bacterium]